VADWLCEVLSPSTRGLDRWPKLRACVRERIGQVLLVDPEARTLEVFALDGATYR
jgi:Uma2 family endonuclease